MRANPKKLKNYKAKEQGIELWNPAESFATEELHESAFNTKNGHRAYELALSQCTRRTAKSCTNQATALQLFFDSLHDKVNFLTKLQAF